MNPSRRDVCYSKKWGNYETKKRAEITRFFYGFVQVAAGEQYMLDVASMIKSAAWIYNIDKSLLGAKPSTDMTGRVVIALWEGYSVLVEFFLLLFMLSLVPRELS